LALVTMRCWLTIGATGTASRGRGAAGATAGVGKGVATVSAGDAAGASTGFAGGALRVKTRPIALAGRARKSCGGESRATRGAENSEPIGLARGAPNVEVEAATRGATGSETSSDVAARGVAGVEPPMTTRGAKGADAGGMLRVSVTTKEFRCVNFTKI
jgi:hypothetical protein